MFCIGCVVKSEDIAFLMEHLHQYAYKWKEIGMALGFHPGELENIRHSAPIATVEQLLAELLRKFSQWPTDSYQVTPMLNRLCDALRSRLVGLGAVVQVPLPSRYDLSSL